MLPGRKLFQLPFCALLIATKAVTQAPKPTPEVKIIKKSTVRICSNLPLLKAAISGMKQLIKNTGARRLDHFEKS